MLRQVITTFWAGLVDCLRLGGAMLRFMGVLQLPIRQQLAPPVYLKVSPI